MEQLLAHPRTAPHHRIAWLITVFVYVALTSLLSLELTLFDGRFSALWLANAGTLAALLIAQPLRRGELLLCAFAAMTITKGVLGQAWGLAIVFSSANCVEVVAACYLIEQTPEKRIDLTQLRGLVQFLISCMGPAPMIAAAIYAGYLHAQGGEFLRIALEWHLAHALGFIVAVPLILVTYSRLILRKGPRSFNIAEPLFYSSAVLALTAIVFSQSLALIYLILPLICLASFRCGYLGAGLSAVVVAFVATSFTVSGSGPIAATTGDPVARIYLLQGFIACCVLTGLPIAVVLNERNRLTVSLSASERRFRELSHAAPIGIMTLDGDRRITYANPELANISGIGLSQLLHQRVGHTLEGVPRIQIDQALEESRRNRTYADAAFGLMRDGHERWFQIRFAPIAGDHQAMAGWIGTVMDVTQLRRSEQRLARSERELRMLADNVGDLICRLNEEGLVLYASAATQRLFNISHREVEGQSLMGFIDRQDRAPVYQALADLASGARHQTRSFRWIEPSGDRRWVEASFRNLPGVETDRQVVVTIRDISERKEAEAAILSKNTQLQEANRLLRLAENVAQIGHWHYDLESASIDWSPLFAAIHGLPPDRPASTDDYAALVGGEQLADMRAAIAQSLSEGQPFRLAVRIHHPDGRWRTIDMQGQGEVEPSGKLTGLFGVCRDITEELEIQETLRQARDRALSEAEARARFLAVMSHEIRTPMTGVLATFELLAQHSEEINWPLPDIPRLVAATQAHARSLMNVLDDVLDQAKLEAGKMDFECVRFDAREILSSAVDMFQGRAREKGIALDIEGADAVPVSGDPNRLTQVITNLIGNAIKFTPDGRITARIEPAAQGTYCIAITDTGIGIPPEAMDRILEPFAQADNSTSRQFGGTGLGLAIVKNLVAAMGGRMEISANPQGGSIFSIILPMIALGGEASFAPVRTDGEGPQIPAGLRVLIVDDTEATRLAAQVHLQALGCQIHGVSGGAQAILAAMEQEFDVAMIDSAMPGMDGATTIRLLRLLPDGKGGMPILGFTAYSQHGRQRALVEAGAAGVIAKPFTGAMLRNGLHDVLQTQPSSVSHGLEDGFMADFPVSIRHEMIDHLAADLERIAAVMGEQDTVEHDRAVHSLKGIAGTYGLDALDHFCAVYEQCRTDYGAVPPAFAEVMRAMISAALVQVRDYAL